MDAIQIYENFVRNATFPLTKCVQFDPISQCPFTVPERALY